MNRKKFVWGIAVVILAFGLVFAGCDNGTSPGNGGEVKGNVPALFPTNWQSLTGEEWEAWIDIAEENMSEQEGESIIAFIENNYNLLSESGKQFWDEILKKAGPVDTHGISLDKWPQENNKNSFSSGMYYRKSVDGLALAVNPMARGDGSNYIPDIFIFTQGSGTEFPLGVWVDREDESLFFTSTTITFDIPYIYDLEQVNYTMNGDTFFVSGYKTVPYTPTAADNSMLAGFNEASFRGTHPWIPATSVINPKVKRNNWFYDIIDYPAQLITNPFASNADIEGTWLVCDYIDNPNTYDPLNTEAPDWKTWEGIRFSVDTDDTYGTYGLAEYYDSWSDEWYRGGIWITATDTYVGSKVSGILTGGIIYEPNDLSNLLAGGDVPEFVIKNYPQGLYLFVQWKSGDYGIRGEEPAYYVFKKQ